MYNMRFSSSRYFWGSHNCGFPAYADIYFYEAAVPGTTKNLSIQYIYASTEYRLSHLKLSWQTRCIICLINQFSITYSSNAETPITAATKWHSNTFLWEKRVYVTWYLGIMLYGLAIEMCSLPVEMNKVVIHEVSIDKETITPLERKYIYTNMYKYSPW